MDCPLCHQPTIVLEKRGEEGSVDRRRRECTMCLHRFTTYELRASELEDLRTRKHDLEQLRRALGNLTSDLLRPADDADTLPAALDVPLP